MECLAMFMVFFKIGAFTFGGGYAMIPLIEKEVVDSKKWISKEEFMDALVVAQSLPGALAVNTAIYIGYKILKIKGAIVALLGTILPSIIIIIAVASTLDNIRDNKYIDLAFKGINGAVPVLVLIAVVSLSKSLKKTTRNIIVCIIATIFLVFFNLSPVIAILFGIIYGVTMCKPEKEEVE